jgi:hypothetical protein
MGRDVGAEADERTTPRSGVITADLTAMPPVDLIAWLGNRQRTGSLHLGRRGVVRKASIVAGCAVRLHSSRPSEGLAQFLRNSGLIPVARLDQALRDGHTAAARLGFVLTSEHRVPVADIRRVLEHQIRELILDAARWTTGRMVFVADDVDVPRPEIEASISLLEIHRLAIARAREWSSFAATFADLDAQWYLDEWALPRHPDAVRDEIVAMLRAGETLAAILRRLPTTTYEIYTRLYELVQAGALSQAPADAHAISISPADIVLDLPEAIADAIVATETHRDQRLSAVAAKPPNATVISSNPSEPRAPTGPRAGLAAPSRDSSAVTAQPTAPSHQPSVAPTRRANSEPARLGPDRAWTPQPTAHLDVAVAACQSPLERQVVRCLDGRRSLRDLQALTSLPEDVLIRVIIDLAERGLVHM